MSEVKSSSYADFVAGKLPERHDVYTKTDVSGASESWHTKDLYLAAAILALKYGTLERVDRTDIRHMRFYFSGAGLDEISAEWTNRKLLVNAAEYADSIRKMKSVIHSED